MSPIPYQGALAPQQVAEIEQARRLYRPIRRAAVSASFFGWTVAVFGGLTLLFNFVSFALSGVVVGVGLCWVGYVELTTIPKLRKLDPEAPKTLGYNQFTLAGVLVVYALWQLFFPEPMSPEVTAQMAEVKQVFDIEGMYRMIRTITYTTLIAVAIGVEAPMAMFYFRRTKMVKDFLAATPPWIVTMLQNGMSL